MVVLCVASLIPLCPLALASEVDTARDKDVSGVISLSVGILRNWITLQPRKHCLTIVCMMEVRFYCTDSNTLWSKYMAQPPKKVG